MSEHQKAAAPTSALDRYFKISERGSSIAAEFRGGLAAFFAMSYIVVLSPLIIGTGADASERILGIAPVAAVTALVAGVMTILMGVIAKQPFAMAAGLGVNALLASTIATTPNLTWADIMGLVVLAGLIMTVLVLTGFRTAVFEAVPESLKTAIVVGIGFFISFIGLVDSGIIRRMPDAAGSTVPVTLGADGHLLGWPTLVFLFGLFLTIALFIRNVKGACNPVGRARLHRPLHHPGEGRALRFRDEGGNRLVPKRAFPGGSEVHHSGLLPHRFR